MANEFDYSVSLSIVHPTADLNFVTQTLRHLAPKIVSRAGDDKRRLDGTPTVPARKVALSHWSANLHDSDKLYSGDVPFSDFLFAQLELLESHRDFFAQLGEEAQIKLFIGWFSKSYCAAELLHAEMLLKCGQLGIDLELHCYA